MTGRADRITDIVAASTGGGVSASLISGLVNDIVGIVVGLVTLGFVLWRWRKAREDRRRDE